LGGLGVDGLVGLVGLDPHPDTKPAASKARTKAALNFLRSTSSGGL
jgi:hypothetical protein